jgi:hypothetical protein
MNRFIIIIKVFTFSLALMSFISTNGQLSSFEIILQNDSMYIEPTKFIRSQEEGFIGLTQTASIYDSLSYFSTVVYEVSNYGDTNGIRFVKQDTIFVYYDIININDPTGGYLLTGYGHNSYENPSHLFNIFTRVDNNLEVIWERVFSFGYVYSGWRSKVLNATDGSFLYACSPNGANITFLLKLSATGDSLDFKEYSGDEAGEVVSLTYNHNSTRYLLHTEWAHYIGNTSICSMIVLNDELEQLDYNFYPDWFNTPYTSILASDGNILTGGSYKVMYPPGTNTKEIVGYKLDSSLNIMNQILCTNPDTISNAAEIISIDYYYPSCIYLGGNHNIQGFSGNDPSWYYITKLNENLEIQYEKYIGGDAYYWLFSVVAAKDGGVLLAGTTSELGAPSHMKDGYFIKLDSTGCITDMPENSNVQIKEVLVYPNPGVNEIYVRTALKKCSIKIFDTQGNCVINQAIEDHIIRLNVDVLLPAIYPYIIKQNNKVIETGKWIKH